MTNIHITMPPLSSQSMADLLCTVFLFCQGTTINGKPFWAYMCIKPSMAQAFREARENGYFKLEDYGTIIESGEGAEVPPDVRQRMERQFGVQHDYEDRLIKIIESLK